MLMRDTMGLLLTETEKIPPLTDHRSAAALPIAGRYRLIDFPLSCMASAGISNIGVVMQGHYASLMEHLRSGKPWDLDRKHRGLCPLPPNLRESATVGSDGNLDCLAGTRDFLKKSPQTYVILSLGTHLFNLDFRALMQAHIDRQADITVVYRNAAGFSERELSRFNLLDIDRDLRILDLERKPHYPKASHTSLDLFVMEKALLESIIDESAARGDHDFLTDALSKKLSAMRVYAYEHRGYTDRIDSLQAYFRNNMIFLDPKIRETLFSDQRPIDTPEKDQFPTRYSDGASVSNSLISDGCIIEGCVENCVLSRGVRVERGAILRNCVIMQDCVIETDAALDYIVFDRDVRITKGRRLLGQASYPLPIAKGSII